MSKEHGDSPSDSPTLLGLAKSTVAGDHSAEKLAFTIRRINGYFPTLHLDDFGDDNLQWYIAQYFKCSALVSSLTHSTISSNQPTQAIKNVC